LQGAKFTSSKIADLSFSTREIHFTVTDSDNHTSPPASRTVAITCAAGSYADGPTSTCKTCAAGKWSAGDHTVTCTACAAGKHGFGQDQTSEAKYCFQCGAGSYSATGSHGDVKHTCTKCSPGTYGASNYAQTSVEHCRACENGKAQDLSGQTACNDCTAGTYNDGKEFSMKVQCRAWDCCKENGEYLNGGSATENTQCLQCPVGSFLKVSGALENAQDLCHDVRQCTLCRAGTWGMGNATKTSEKAECAACAAGKFSKYSHDANSEIIMHDKPDSCKKCAAGKYQDQEGQSSCSVCDLGSYAPAGTPSCTKCEAGRYGNSGILPAANLGHCTVCENGQYQDGTGATACKTCACGQYQDGTGQPLPVACTQCAVGKFLAVPQDPTVAPMVKCASCALGKFAGLGACACTDCPAGEFCDAQEDCGASAQQVISAAGFVTHAQTAGVCKACAKGKYSDWFGKKECTHCPDGQYQDATSYTKCHACRAGQFSSRDESNVLDVNALCENCPIGHFASGDGATKCTLCPAGKYTESRFGGAISCSVCLKGHFSAAGASQCTACSSGTYQADVGATKCTSCAAGKFNPAGAQVSAAACRTCPTGTYNEQAGKASCDLSWKCCGKGEYLHFAAPSDLFTHEGSCKTCPAGKFQDKSEVCLPDLVCKDLSEVYCKCATGEFLEGATAEFGGTCAACPAGQFKPAEADPRAWASLGCEACAIGQFGALPSQAGAAACESCKAGQYSASAGADKCTSCEAGKYSAAQSSTCESCAASEWSAWGSCSATCDGGTQVRTRQLLGNVAAELQRENQCPKTQSRKCNTVACPKTDQCHYLKCRFAQNPVTGKFGIQVYHHGKEPHNVHHCKLYEMGGGKRHCQCSCWTQAPIASP